MAKPAAKGQAEIEAAGERVMLRPLRQGELAIALQGQNEPIGVIDYRAGSPGPGWLAIGRVALAGGLRAHGHGAEAVRLLEAEAQRLGLAHRFLATAGLDDGLGFYFWLRLGYRPARPGEAGWPTPPSRDIIAMVRTPDG